MRNDRPFFVKICGVTEPRDAVEAVRLGADRIGLVLASESPRRVTLEGAGTIARELPEDVIPVGVFVNPTVAEVAEAFDSGAIGLAQLHGEEPPDLCDRMPRPWMKAIRVVRPEDLDRALTYGCAEILVDPRVDGKRGGTGVPLPDDVVRAALGLRQRQMVLAGGLGPDNVGALLSRALRIGRLPRGIDAASGLESEPGRKDPEKMRRFFAAIDEFTAHPGGAR